MGSFWTYQAIPETAPLVERARTDDATGYFFCRSVLWGRSLQADDIEAALQDTLWRIREGLEEDAPFASASEAEARASELARDMAALVATSPGIEQRCFGFQGAVRISHAVAREADRLRQPDAALVERLAYGGDMLVPNSCDEYDNPIRIVNAGEVRRGADLLGALDATSVYEGEPSLTEVKPWVDPPASWSVNSVGGPSDFEKWRSLYAEAAARGEAVLCQRS